MINSFKKYLKIIRKVGELRECETYPYPFSQAGEDFERCLAEALQGEWYGEETIDCIKKLSGLEIDIETMGEEDEDHPNYWDRSDNWQPEMTVFTIDGAHFKASYAYSSWGDGENIDLDEVVEVKKATKTVEYWEEV